MSGKSSIKPMGLRKKPTFNEIIDYITHGQEVIKYPNRYFRQLRDSPWLSQIDGEDTNDIEAQQQNQAKIIQRDTIIREVSQQAGVGATDARVYNSTTNHNYHNTFVGNPNQPPPPPPGTSQADVPMSANASTNTRHPLSRDTGTGPDYAETQNPFTRPPPPPPGSAPSVYSSNVHQSTSYAGRANSSSSMRGDPDAPVNPVNPHVFRFKPDQKPPQIFDLTINDDPMTYHEQEEANRAYAEEEAREKRATAASAVRADLVESDRGPMLARQMASVAHNSVMRAHHDRALINAQARTQRNLEWVQSRAQAHQAAQERALAVIAKQQAEQALAATALENQRSANTRAQEERDIAQRTREADLERMRQSVRQRVETLEKATKRIRTSQNMQKFQHQHHHHLKHLKNSLHAEPQPGHQSNPRKQQR